MLFGDQREWIWAGASASSSTLFNAVARAGLEITERHPHSWPSDYIGAGFDAMINYPESDFKFVNNTQGNVYLFSAFDWETRKLTVQIFGKPIYEPGMSVI
jgi:vancomycin resistance protein YoaR